MEQNCRDVFKKIGMLGASALALVGVSKRAKADDRNERQNPRLGLWDLTIPVQQGLLAPLYYKYAISEGGYVATGNEDANADYLLPYTYGPTMGTYTRTGPYSYRLRERRWVMGAGGFQPVPPISLAPPWSPGTGGAGPAPVPTFSTT